MSKNQKAVINLHENQETESKIEAIKNLIFGDNIQAYDSEFETLKQDILDKKKILEDLIEEVSTDLRKSIDDVYTDVNIRITDILKSYQGSVKQSMSRKGNCWDNAVAESFFKSLKVEWAYKHDYNLRSEAELSIFQWIETWYNRRRIHSTLGYKTIEEFENEMSNQKIAA